MDNCPERLVKAYDIGGNIAEPFEEWWVEAASAYPTVPENVARQWLHRHWRNSPYKYLRSRNYKFDLIRWQTLKNILTTWGNFQPDNTCPLEKGKDLIEAKAFPGCMHYVPEYMLQHGKFPEPIIVLDNCDGHHGRDYPREIPVPEGYILMEGHTRLNVGIYLETIGKLPPQDVWLMTKSAR